MNKDNVKLAIAPIGWTNDDMPELGSEKHLPANGQRNGAGRVYRQRSWQQISARSGGAEADAGYSRHADLQRPVQHLLREWPKRKKPSMNSLTT